MDYELILKLDGVNYYVGDGITVAGMAMVQEDVLGYREYYQDKEVNQEYTGVIADIIMMNCIPTLVFDDEKYGRYIYFRVDKITEVR